MRGKPQVFTDFSGGINTAADEFTIGANQTQDALNVTGAKRGAVRKRAGHQQRYVLPVAASQLFFSRSMLPRFLVAFGGGTLYDMNLGSIYTLRTGLSTLDRWSFVEGKAGNFSVFFGSNGWDTPLYTMNNVAYDWTATVGTVPKAKLLTSHGNRIWAANINTTPVVGGESTLAFSEIGAGREWPVANTVQFDPNDGNPITGIGPVGPYLLVCKKNQTWIVYDLDTGANRRLSTSYGTIAHRSIVETPRGTFFLADEGVMVTNGSSIDRVSKALPPTEFKVTISDQELITAAWSQDRYWLNLPTGIIWEYDPSTDSWWRHGGGVIGLVQTGDGFEGGGIPSLIDAGDDRLYGLRSTSVDRLFEPGKLTDGAGSPFAARYVTPPATFGEPHRRKRVREIAFDGKGIVTADVFTDFDDDAATLSVAANLGSDDLTEKTIPSPGVSRAWSVRFGNATADPFEIHSLSYMVQPRKD